MIDLSEFTPTDNSRSRCSEYKQQTYLIVTDTKMRLKLGRKVGEEAVRYFGTKCRVLVQPITGEIAICRGDAKRISSVSTSYCISLSSEQEAFVKNHGEFRRMFFDVRWENDERGNKFLYLEPNGLMERAES